MEVLSKNYNLGICVLESYKAAEYSRSCHDLDLNAQCRTRLYCLMSKFQVD